MVLRCSLLGHDYGDPIVEHEREERGSEVIVTVQEYEECTRCNTKHIISENTEVTSLATRTDADPHPDDPDSEPEPERTDAPAADTATTDAETATADAETATDDAEFIDDETATSDAADPATTAPPEQAADESSSEPDVPTDENGDPITDDGEILTDEPDDSHNERGHGEWPDSDDVGQPIGADATPADWPEDGPSNESDAADGDEATTNDWPDTEETEPIDDDAVLLDAETTESDAEAPNTNAEPIDTAPVESALASGSGIERAATAPSPTEGAVSPDDRSRTELYCPRCEYVAGADRSSLRTGDICPECRKGYLGTKQQ